MPDISKISLPSGTTYDIKDATARQMISAGVTFIVAWDGTTAPVAADIPEGVVVTYNATQTTGTLKPKDATGGAFYLVKSKTLPSSETFDSYDEYVVIKPNPNDNTTWYWEKIGDTKLNLSEVVTGVTLNKSTDTVIGTDASFTITQPTIALETGATAGTGVISVATGIDSASASGDEVTALTGLGSPSTASVIGASATLSNTQPTILLSSYGSAGTGKIALLSDVSSTNTYVKAQATGGSTAWNSKDIATVVLGYNPDSATFVKSLSVSEFKLKTTTVTGVSGSTTASKATAATSQTTATGGGTASSTNTDWLKGVSVSDETLVIGAATMNTQTTTQFTFGDVTVPKAASSSTRVATGETANSDGYGATVVTHAAIGNSGNALTSLGDPSTKKVIGESATFTVTQPTIALSTGSTSSSGAVSLSTGVSTTPVIVGATASGGGASWNNKNTQTVVTGYSSPTTDTVLGTGSTITVTPTTTNVKAIASGANTAWNSKDSVTVLTNASSITVTKGE